MTKLMKTNKQIEKSVVGTYKKIEKGVVGTYQKIEDKFVDTFLTDKEETGEEEKTTCNPPVIMIR